MSDDAIKLEPSWKAALKAEFQLPYMQQLKEFLSQEKRKGKKIFPPGNQIFEAFNQTPLSEVKVVIIGQDPYHGPGQAHGLCFSVSPGVPPPPSLNNIFQELSTDVGVPRPNHGYLLSWAKQGVFLLNAVLTVEQSKAASHHGKGWEQFTDKVIEILNAQSRRLVFVLWGSPAQKKGRLIDTTRHVVVKSPHPSPLSAHRGFFGSRPFSQVNEHLKRFGEAPVDWRLPLFREKDAFSSANPSSEVIFHSLQDTPDS